MSLADNDGNKGMTVNDIIVRLESNSENIVTVFLPNLSIKKLLISPVIANTRVERVRKSDVWFTDMTK